MTLTHFSSMFTRPTLPQKKMLLSRKVVALLDPDPRLFEATMVDGFTDCPFPLPFPRYRLPIIARFIEQMAKSPELLITVMGECVTSQTFDSPSLAIVGPG